MSVTPDKKTHPEMGGWASKQATVSEFKSSRHGAAPGVAKPPSCR